jgi:hypothetical protein
LSVLSPQSPDTLYPHLATGGWRLVTSHYLLSNTIAYPIPP